MFSLLSPLYRDIKFGPITGNTGGWNVISSSEMSDDGKARTEKMLASTEGVTAVDGGKKAFSGRNEELKTERFDGDANNFTHSTGESSNMMLNENIVTGDENNRHVEKNSSTVSHSSNVVRSSTNSGSGGDFHQNSKISSNSRNEQQQHSNTSSSDHRSCSNENVKLTQDPQMVQEAFRLAQQPGDLLSRHVERHDPHTNIVTEKKQLADGTVVTTKRFETSSSDHVDIQATSRDNRSSSATNNSNESTFKTSRDEEAFRLSQQVGNVLSRNVEMSDPNTRVITEKKQLADGTVVTTKRYESARDHSNVQSTHDHSTKSSNITSDSSSKTANMTFATARDEEAYHLSQQPGKVLSRDIKMENPSTRIITEKKELVDGTIVTTKRYETVDNEGRNFSKEQSSDSFAKNLRNDATTMNSNKSQNVHETTTNVKQSSSMNADQTSTKTRDEQDETLISRRVERYDNRTNMITEKKELPNGTTVTIKRYETVEKDTPLSQNYSREQNIANQSKSSKTSTNQDTKTNQRQSLHEDEHQTQKHDDQPIWQPVTQIFRTPRDEEAFRLSQKPGKIISRDVTITDATTRMITEKKELTDGTVVTTKRYETIDKESPKSKNISRDQKTVEQAKNFRTSTHENKEQTQQKEIIHSIEQTSENVRKTSDKVDKTSRQSFHEDVSSQKTDDQTTWRPANQTFRTPRDEEAFRLSQQPGKIISRDVTLTNPTTRMITEKKELTDGTVVTTKRYETISDKNESVEKISSRNNVESQNIKKNVAKTNAEVRKSTTDNESIDQREVVEEKITKKFYDTSCACPENRHDPKAHTSKFINQERTEDYDVNADIITNVDERVQRKNQEFVDMEKNREEVIRREQVKKLEQKRVDEQFTKKISRELEVDSAHKAFASSLRCVTPPERVSTPNIPRNDRSQRSPSRDTTTSKISSSTVTLKKSSNTDVRKADKVERRPTAKSASPEKNPRKITPDSRRSTIEVVETVQIDLSKKDRSVNPQKITQQSPKNISLPRKDALDHKKTPGDGSPHKSGQNADLPRFASPSKTSGGAHTPRDSSPQKPNEKKGLPKQAEPTARDSSPVKSCPDSPRRDVSHKSQLSNKTPSRDASPKKPSVKKDLSRETQELTRETFPRGSTKAHPESSTPRESSPQKSRPTSGASNTREVSPIKSSKTPSRDASPQKLGTQSQPSSQPMTPREHSPMKSSPTSGSSTPRDVSPQKLRSSSTNPSRDASPQKHGAQSYPSTQSPSPRETSPTKLIPTSGSSTPRDASPHKHYNKTHSMTAKTARRDDETDEIYSSTIVIDNKEKLCRDDLTIVQTIDTKNMSATTSVSDLEYIVPDHDLITDLDSEDIEIKVNLRNLSDTEDLQIRTTIEEISGKKGKIPQVKPVDKLPGSHKTASTSRETVPSRSSKTPERDISPHKPGQGQDTHLRDRKPECDKPADHIDDRKKPFNRSETFEERARKLIGVASDNDEDDDGEPHYAKPTFASLPNGSRFSETRERKATVEKETQEIESVMIAKKKTVSSETEDFIDREKMANRKTTQAYSSPHANSMGRSAKPTSSPDRSPSRTDSKPKTDSQKPANCEITITNATKTIKTTESRQDSAEKKKPSTVANNKMSQLVTTDETTTMSRRTDKETIKGKTTVPETHITVAKINISPVRKTSKTSSVVEMKKEIKVSPSIRLVKHPTTDVSSTEPDSDVETETDQDLIRNIDKGTGKATRKKLIQSRKDSAPVTRTTTKTEKEKVSRSTSESLFKTDLTIKAKKTATVSKPRESSPKKDSKRPAKCVTTKTINVTGLNTINSSTLADVVIDARQAKSSREPSPNKTVPIPVKFEDEVNGHQLIYPDKITEPEDNKKVKSKVINIPIFEEKTRQFVGLEITEVETTQSEVIIEEDETDEHERTVINSSSLERADRKRNSIQIDPIDDEEEEDHAHLLSVSQKVNKFIETAEDLKKPRTSTPLRMDGEKLDDVSEPEDDSMLSVNRKVTKFSTISDEMSSFDRKSKRFEETTQHSFDEVDENLRNDDCLMSVSDKVSKFITSAEKLVSSAPQKSPELVKNVMKTSTKSPRPNERDGNVNESFLTKEKVATLTQDDRYDSKSTLRSAGSDITLKSTEAIKRARAVFENNTATRDVKRHDDIMSRPSVFEAKRTSTSDRKVSKESVSKVQRAPKAQENFLAQERQSPAKESSPRQSPAKDSFTSPTTPRRGSSDSARTPIYLRDQVSTKKDLFEKRISSSKIENEMSHQKSLSPQTSVQEKSRPGSSTDKYRSGSTEKYQEDYKYRSGSVDKHNSGSPVNRHRSGSSADEKYRSGSEEVHQATVTRKFSSDKHYMSHTVASLEHVNNERRESEIGRTSRRDSLQRESQTRSPTKLHRNTSESTNDSAAFEAPRTPKFGVELKRTDSGKNVQQRRVSTGGDSINIEEIFDLVELEKLLEIVVGYEQRRRIRAQIRIVKRNISERKTSVDAKTSSRFTSTSTTTSKKSKSEQLTHGYAQPTRKPRDESTTQAKVPARYTSPTRKSRDESGNQAKIQPSYSSQTSRTQADPNRQTRAQPDYSSPSRKSRDESVSATKVTRTVTEKPEKITRNDSRLQRITTTTTTTRTQSGTEKPRETTTTTTQTQSGNEKPREVTTKTTKLIADKSSPRAIIDSLNKNSGKGKATENVVRIVKKSSATSSTQKMASTTRESRTDTDCVTSSYGVGPTDSNGLPLFGLRALKNKNPTTTTESKSESTSP